MRIRFLSTLLIFTPLVAQAAMDGIEHRMPPLPTPDTKTSATSSAAVPMPAEAPGPLQTSNQQNVLQTPQIAPALPELSEADKAAADLEAQKEAIRDNAFSKLKNELAPLTPDQIQELKQLLDSTQRITASPNVVPPRPVSQSLVISLSPGVTPPVVRLAAGYVSSLVFVDSSGAPWPIVSYGLGNPGVFNIQWDQKSNLMMLQSVKNHAAGNLAIRLFGNPTPIMLSLVTGQKEVDYRVDLQVQGRGPHANPEIVSNTLPEKANPILVNLLDGVPPKDSRLLQVEGDPAGRAWLKEGKLYYRSSVTILSPAWQSFMTSADGTRVYEMLKTPLLLASRDGTPIQIKLSGF